MTPPGKPGKNAARALWLLFSAFVVYGTTIPFRFNLNIPFAERAARIDWSWVSARYDNISVGDVVQNVLLFIPFGFLGYASLKNKRSRIKIFLLVPLGAGLSALVEFLQIFSETRTPSLSDLLFNSVGTGVGVVMGIWLRRFVAGFKSHSGVRRFFDVESAYPAFVFLTLAVAACWGPFDFSLDAGLAWAKVKQVLHHPGYFSPPNDDLANFIRFLLVSLFACRLAKEAGLSRPAALGALSMAALGACLEASQMIVQSRSPEFQDALVNVMGALAGGVAFHFPGFHEKPLMWGSLGVSGVFLAAAMRGMHPYTLSGAHREFNWIPFLPHYEITSLMTLDNFTGNAMVYFPMGFLLAYFFPGSKRAVWISALLASSMALGVEWAQGWIAGRYSDVTDVLGALLGSAAGSLAVSRGWRAFREYLAADKNPV